MYHAHHADHPERLACGARPQSGKIPIWTDDATAVSCRACIRVLALRPAFYRPLLRWRRQVAA